MPPERVTITIRPSTSDEGPLTVEDGMRQILDFFELLRILQGDNEGSVVQWRLVRVRKESPLEATAEAFATVPGVAAEVIARHAKTRAAHSLRALAEGKEVQGLEPRARAKAQSLMERNLNGIGETIYGLTGEPIAIVERHARAALRAIRQTELTEQAAAPDLQRKEIGSIEGSLAEITSWRGQPAVRVRERLSGKEVMCVLSQELASRTGPGHAWLEAWEGRRVLVMGEISYAKDGLPARVDAEDLKEIDAPVVNYQDIADPSFTNGLSPEEHIRRLWSDEHD